MSDFTHFTPPDQGARDRIVEDLGATLFVEAGAGSGKTTALVDRVLALVETGSAELANVAAITFTEKAATELRDRLRREIERKIVAKPSGERADRLRLALEQLDGAAIGTLHSFAQRILTEHPIEAGLPPRVEVSDEVSSDVAFDARWRSFCDELLADPEYERTILVMVAANVRFDSLRLLAAAFNDNWDLVEERVPETSPEPPDVHAAVASVLDDLDRICCEPCDDDGDSLRLHLDDIAEYVAWLRTIPDELDLLEALGEKGPRKRPTFKVANRGKKEAWPNGVAELRARVREAGDRLIQIPADAASAAVKRLGTVLRRFTLDEAEKRRKAGELEFHDLLVIARSLLRDPEVGATVRKYLHARYERLLLDEFQDTDPIQVEIAVLIAATDPGLGGADPADIQWDAVEVTPGHLFFVGDPKQSIYRFRRADIAMFLNASRRFGAATDGTVELSANFRTAAPIIDWINATFGCLIDVAGEADLPVPSQPRYASLDAVRPAPPSGPAVARIGALAHVDGVNADGIRAREAADVVAAVSRAVQEGWSVETEDGQWRPARLGDITILVPARTSLPFLEEGLDTAGIPYRAESNSLVYSSRAVRDLLMIVRVIADPTNGLHLLAALRTPLFACGDDDLFRFRCERGGHWSYLREQPDTVPADDPVLRCLEYLRSLWEQRYWLAPSELLDLITRERRAMDLGFAEGRPRDVWRRLRFVVDQARAWDEATGGNLRQYLDWVAMQTAEGRAGRRGSSPRNRRRRRSDHDHPRRERARVPDHDRVGHVHRPAVAPGTSRSGVPTERTGRLQGRKLGQDRRVPRMGPDRRADELPRTDPAPLCRLHEGPRSLGRLDPPEGSYVGTPAGKPDQRRAFGGRDGRSLRRTGRPRGGDRRRHSTGGYRTPATHARRRVESPVDCSPRPCLSTDDGFRDLVDRGGRAGRRGGTRRPRPAEATP